MAGEEKKVADFYDHFSHRAEGYAHYRPHYPPELCDFLFDLTNPSNDRAASLTNRPFGTVWEAGCGSGQFTLDLAERFAFVYATDASEKQIAHARSHPRVEYRVARAESSGLPDRSVDLAVAAQAAHWFDLEGYYAEVRRVVRPGRHIALIVYGIHSTDDVRIDPIVKLFYHETLRCFWPPQRRLVEEEYKTIPFPFDELPSPRFEMRANWNLSEMLGYVETWSAVGELVKAKGRAEVDSFRTQMAKAWGEPDLRKIIHWPLSMRLGRV